MYPLHRLDQLVASAVVPPLNVGTGPQVHDFYQAVSEAAAEAEKIKTYLLSTAFSCTQTNQLKVYIQTYQAICVSLANNIFDAIASVPRLPYAAPRLSQIKKLYINIQDRLQDVLSFIERYFSQYFDTEQKVPANYAHTSRKKLQSRIKNLKASVHKKTKDRLLINILFEPLAQPDLVSGSELSYKQLAFYKLYVAAIRSVLHQKQNCKPHTAFIRCMIEMNVRTPSFISYYMQEIQNKIPEGADATAAVSVWSAALRTLKTYELAVVAQGTSVIQLLSECINNEISSLRRTQQPSANPPQESTREYPKLLQTHLSVSQFALMLRLLVDTNIIKCSNQSLFLKIIAQNFKTTRTSDISPESLRVKYYNSEPAAINSIKSHLLTMISHLRTYN
jgi:hypothetical protein